MWRSQQKHCKLRDENFALPDSNNNIVAHYSDEDPNHDSVDTRKKRLELYLQKGDIVDSDSGEERD